MLILTSIAHFAKAEHLLVGYPELLLQSFLNTDGAVDQVLFARVLGDKSSGKTDSKKTCR